MPGPVRVERADFALRLDPRAGTLELALADGPVLRLTPEAGDAGPARGALPLLARGRIKGPAGPAERLELQRAAGRAAGRRTVVEVPEDGSGLAIERGPGAVAEPDAATSEIILALPAGSGLTARRVALGGPDDVLVELGPGGGAARLLVGLAGGPREGRLRVAADGEGALRVLREGPAAGAPRLWIGVGGPEAALRALWALRAGAELGAEAPAQGAVTWPGARRSPALPHLAPVPVVRVDPQRDGGPAPEGAWHLAEDGPWRARVGRAHAVRVADPLRHAFASRRLWLNAVGPLDPAGPDLPRLRTRLTLAGLAGGLVELAAPPEALPAERLDLLRRALPPLAREADAVDDATLRVPLLGGRLAVLRVNHAQVGRPLGLDLAALGLHGPHHVFDFFAERDLGACVDAVPETPAPPGGCRLLGITPPADRPQVVGSTLHVGMGTLEAAALRGGAEALQLVLRHPGAHRGAVFVALPGEPRARRVPVAFRDEAVVEVPPPA